MRVAEVGPAGDLAAAAFTSARRRVHVVVRRSDRASRQEFSVDVADPVTVLDVLRQIQERHDPSLGFRYSCRVAMCGTCGIRVDGRSALACRSVIPPDRDSVEVAPLGGLPVVRDLIVDTAPFWDQWARVTPWFVPAADERERTPRDAADAELAESALGCIACGACYSTCELTDERGDYLGPAALNRALALIADPRDGAGRERLELVGGRAGVDRCHYVGACTSACPVGLDPARAIVELRRLRSRGVA
jgi:succinate dehydrogenase / fumarate reductase iron-sulfur subunit/fumarate reductase iron-sulfur subunit